MQNCQVILIMTYCVTLCKFYETSQRHYAQSILGVIARTIE